MTNGERSLPIKCSVFHRAVPRLWVKVNSSASKDSLILRNSKTRYDTLFLTFLNPYPTSYPFMSCHLSYLKHTKCKLKKKVEGVRSLSLCRCEVLFSNTSFHHPVLPGCTILSECCSGSGKWEHSSCLLAN